MMLITLIAVVIIVIGLILTIVLLTNQRKKGAIIIFIIAIIITVSLFGWIRYQEENYQNEIRYELQILTNEEGEYSLNVPYLDNSKLRTELMNSVNNNIEFITINKTPILSTNNAMKIVNQGNITISAKIREHAWPEMSLLATDDISYCSYWLWCNKTDVNQTIEISISATISYWNGETNWNTDESETISLENGWNEITLLIDQWEA